MSMPQEYQDYVAAYVALYTKQTPATSSTAAALGVRQAQQGDPLEPCWKVMQRIAELEVETEPTP